MNSGKYCYLIGVFGKGPKPGPARGPASREGLKPGPGPGPTFKARALPDPSLLWAYFFAYIVVQQVTGKFFPSFYILKFPPKCNMLQVA